MLGGPWPTWLPGESGLEISVSELNISETERVNETNLKAGVAELKVGAVDATENELFYNMFGEAAKLASKVLCKGKMVRCITIYGIAVAVHKNRCAQLLKLILKEFVPFKDVDDMCHFKN